MFTLLEFECLGACDRAPIVMVNNEHWHEKVRPEDVGTLVDEMVTRARARSPGVISRLTMTTPAASSDCQAKRSKQRLKSSAPAR